MGSRHFATYFDSGYLARGLTLHASLVGQHGDPVLHVLCLDDVSYRALSARGDPTLQPWTLASLEAHDPELAAVRPARSRVEYYFTAGPPFLKMLLDVLAADDITYVDSDMQFLGDPEVVFDEAPEASTLLVEHRFPARLSGLADRFGRFNVGWVTIRRTTEGLALLQHWRSQCLEWCYDRVEPGRFADQKYLDEFPSRFAGVHVIGHLGVDAAPWNASVAPIDEQDGSFTAGGQELILFHFHDLRLIAPHVFDLNFRQYGNRPTTAVKDLYRRYLTKLIAHGGADLTSARRSQSNLRGLVSITTGALRNRDLLWH